MVKTISFLGLMVAIIMIVLASVPMPQSDRVEAHESADDGCALREIALDEGYGVSRTIVQRECKTEP